MMEVLIALISMVGALAITLVLMYRYYTKEIAKLKNDNDVIWMWLRHEQKQSQYYMDMYLRGIAIIKKSFNERFDEQIKNPPPPPPPPQGRELGKPISEFKPKKKLKFHRSEILGESKFEFEEENEYTCKSMRELIYEIDWENLKINNVNGGECSPVVENFIGELFKAMEKYSNQEIIQTMKQVLRGELTPSESIKNCIEQIRTIDVRIKSMPKAPPPQPK